MKKILIWGASGHAKTILSHMDYSKYEVIAFIDKNKKNSSFKGISVCNSFESLSDRVDLKNLYFIIAIGGDKGAERIEIHDTLVEKGLKPLTFIHPEAWVDKTATIMEGAQILGMAAVSAEVVIGPQTIINTNATVDHETTIGAGCHIMPAATIAGCCNIDDLCTIGSNATILPRISICRESIVGAGAVLTKNIVKKGVFVGIPAKEVI